ncbi:hypothetical protein [uncultured Methanobrevibacter sp.]|uniref:hypothetical protein n=1 Tax=uncultured Methanobrevibacter sp. TaxID=253161 RepID=UPI002632EC22|nr:hypothetical protein [uncultured Methanobrevibacter sp.]
MSKINYEICEDGNEKKIVEEGELGYLNINESFLEDFTDWENDELGYDEELLRNLLWMGLKINLG